jgi:hypothetical protein
VRPLASNLDQNFEREWKFDVAVYPVTFSRGRFRHSNRVLHRVPFMVIPTRKYFCTQYGHWIRPSRFGLIFRLLENV